MEMPNANEYTKKLISDNPNLFKNNSETIFAIEYALLKYSIEVDNFRYKRYTETEDVRNKKISESLNQIFNNDLQNAATNFNTNLDQVFKTVKS